MRDQCLGFGVCAGAPVRSAEPRADDGAAVTVVELRDAGHADRPPAVLDDQEVEPLASLALAGEPCDIRQGSSICRYGPHEKNFVTSGSAPSPNSERASAALA